MYQYLNLLIVSYGLVLNALLKFQHEQLDEEFLLYQLKQTILKDNVTREDAIENIDIGGPTMLRRDQ